MAQFLADRGLDTAGFQLAFPPELVESGVVASSFVAPQTTFQQLRPALAHTESMQFRHPDHAAWPERKARPHTADEPRFATFLKSEIEKTPVGKPKPVEEEKKRGGLLDRMGSVLRPAEKEPAPVGVYDGLVVDASSIPEPEDPDEASAPKLVTEERRPSGWKSLLSFRESPRESEKPPSPPEEEDSKSDEKIVATYGDDRRKRGDVVIADVVAEAPEEEYRSSDMDAQAPPPPPPPPSLTTPKPKSIEPLPDVVRSRNPKLDRLQFVVESAEPEVHHAAPPAPVAKDSSVSRNPKLERLMAEVVEETTLTGEIGSEASTPETSRKKGFGEED